MHLKVEFVANTLWIDSSRSTGPTIPFFGQYSVTSQREAVLMALALLNREDSLEVCQRVLAGSFGYGEEHGMAPLQFRSVVRMPQHSLPKARDSGYDEVVKTIRYHAGLLVGRRLLNQS